MPFFRKAAVYLGLADDESYDDEYEYDYEYADEEYEEPAHERPVAAAPPPDPRRKEHSAVRTVAPEPQRSPAVIRTMPVTSARVHVVEPRGFNDAQEVGDRLKAEQPVILNLQGCDRDLQRRLIDFSSGLAYAVGGSMSRVADQVFLLTPSNVEVSQEEKDRLQARGLYRS
jgi:cell division inhibitor SepF